MPDVRGGKPRSEFGSRRGLRPAVRALRMLAEGIRVPISEHCFPTPISGMHPASEF
jgi:hypothetical protein